MPYTLLDFPLQINTPIPAHTQTHTVRVTHSSSYLPLVHTNPLTHSRACSQKGFHFVSTFKAAQGPLSNITILLSLSLSLSLKGTHNHPFASNQLPLLPKRYARRAHAKRKVSKSTEEQFTFSTHCLSLSLSLFFNSYYYLPCLCKSSLYLSSINLSLSCLLSIVATILPLSSHVRCPKGM